MSKRADYVRPLTLDPSQAHSLRVDPTAGNLHTTCARCECYRATPVLLTMTADVAATMLHVRQAICEQCANELADVLRSTAKPRRAARSTRKAAP